MKLTIKTETTKEVEITTPLYLKSPGYYIAIFNEEKILVIYPGSGNYSSIEIGNLSIFQTRLERIEEMETIIEDEFHEVFIMVSNGFNIVYKPGLNRIENPQPAL